MKTPTGNVVAVVSLCVMENAHHLLYRMLLGYNDTRDVISLYSKGEGGLRYEG